MGDDKERGLYGKYEVRRRDGQSIEDVFVLELKDPKTWIPLMRYAEAAEADGYAALASELRDKIEVYQRRHDEENRPVTLTVTLPLRLARKVADDQMTIEVRGHLSEAAEAALRPTGPKPSKWEVGSLVRDTAHEDNVAPVVGKRYNPLGPVGHGWYYSLQGYPEELWVHESHLVDGTLAF